MTLADRDAWSAQTWLVGRPIAHRGLHDAAHGLIENSPAAARAAIARNLAIECDVQRTADGDAVVFHDFELGRLTVSSDRVRDLSSKQLGRLSLAGSDDKIATLTSLLDVIGGRVPLVCEVKSAFDGDMRLADRVAAVIQDYAGPVAIKSFDPVVIAHLRKQALGRPLGIVSEANFDDPEWRSLTLPTRQILAHMLHYSETRPDFLSFHVDDLPHAVPNLFRTALRLPVMTWTVRSSEQRRRAAEWADQIVFEGFVP